MAWKQANVTLGASNTRITTTHTPVLAVMFENASGNGELKVGDVNLTSVIYSFTVAAAAKSPFIGPFAGASPFNLEDIWLLGTQNNIIRVFYVTH